MGVMLAVISSILLAISNVLLKKGFKDFQPSISFFILSVLSILLWVPVGLLLGVDFGQPVFGLAVGLASAVLGQAVYIYVLEKGQLSITATILSSFSTYTIIFSMLFNNERPSMGALVFIALTIVGTIIVSLPEKLVVQDFHKFRYIAWAIIGAVSIGAADTLTKYYINQTSAGAFLFYVSFMQILVSFSTYV